MFKRAILVCFGVMSSWAFADGGNGWFCEPWVRSYIWTYDWEQTQRDGLDAVTDSYRVRETKDGSIIYDYIVRAGYDLDSKSGEFNTYDVVVKVENKDRQLSCQIQSVQLLQSH